MTSDARTKKQVFENTREMLAMAEGGFIQAIGSNPTQRRAGLMNLFTYGRSVTFAIQTMKSVDPDFEAWWQPYQEKMKADPLMKYFNDTRVEVIHQGQLSVHSSTVLGARGPVNVSAMIGELNKYAPPGTIGTFFGEPKTGGSGWEVRMADGSVQRVYFVIPDALDIKSELSLTDPPKEHTGQPIVDTSIANIGKLYLDNLRSIVAEFEARFRLPIEAVAVPLVE